jgi:hypothetical protein
MKHDGSKWDQAGRGGNEVETNQRQTRSKPELAKKWMNSDNVHACNQQELDDLMAITPPLIKDKESRARYGEFFLNYDLYPPVVSPPMSREQRLHPLQIVEFDTV